jgi:23S rRNA (guanosine2251-2'-O)-methyltransferase
MTRRSTSTSSGDDAARSGRRPDHIGGLHAVQAALRAGRVEELWLDVHRRDARIERLLETAREQGVAVHRVPHADLDRLLQGLGHQGAVARCSTATHWGEGQLESILSGLDQPPFLLVLDGVQDPHNLGACLRTADAAGLHAVIVPKDRAAGLTPVVRKVASGAAEHVPFIPVTNLARTLRSLKDREIWLIGAAGDATQSLFDADLTGPLALVLGGEGKGLRRLTREHCDTLVHIPMLGSVESLNVSVAAGICMFEAVRQRAARAR